MIDHTTNAKPRRDREGALAKDVQKSIPLAYLITFSCYGARLHGDDSGSVNRKQNLPGAPLIPPNRGWFTAERTEMKQAPYELGSRQRAIVLRAIRKVCAYRERNLLAAHVRSSHVHIVVSAREPPETVLNSIKAYASRALNQSDGERTRCRRWTRHGSTRYLWKPAAVVAAIEYVVYGQGKPMALWQNPDRPAW